MALEYKLREFTVDEYHRMAATGVLGDDERVELLDGAIVEMSPIGSLHWGLHAQIVAYLNQTVAGRAVVAGQLSLPLGRRDEPQPDIAILARKRYVAPLPLPAPADIYAVIELSDTSLRKDLGPKLRVYGRHGISDYLVVDLDRNLLLHHRLPHEAGYGACDRLHPGDTFVLAALHDVRLDAAEFLDLVDRP